MHLIPKCPTSKLCGAVVSRPLERLVMHFIGSPCLCQYLTLRSTVSTVAVRPLASKGQSGHSPKIRDIYVVDRFVFSREEVHGYFKREVLASV